MFFHSTKTELATITIHILKLLYWVSIVQTFTLGTRGNSLAKSGRPKAGKMSVGSARFVHFGPHTRFSGLWPAGFSKRVASGTQGSRR